MLTLRYIWLFVKKYWGILLAIVAFIVGMVLLRKGNVDVLKLIEGINDDHQKDLQALKRKEEEIAREKEKLVEEERQKLEAVDKKYDELEKNLEAEREERVEEILKETNSDPDRLAEELAKITGSKKLN